MRKTILVVVILALAGGGYYAYSQYTKKDDPPTISSGKVTRGDVVQLVGATGTLQAVTTVQVGSQVSGIVQTLEGVDFNTIVHKGQVIARLDPSLFQTQIDGAKANLLRSQADLQRMKVAATDATTKLVRAKELFDKKLISQSDLEAAQLAVTSNDSQVVSQAAAVTQSDAALQQAVVNLDHTVITAPIDGLVISRNVDVGQTVAASMSAPTLFILAADLTKMQVVASLDESDVGRIRPGQRVTFRVDAYPTETFTGAVSQVRLQPTTVQNVVTYSTVINVPNPNLKLKPGMTANVNVEIEMMRDVLRVPNAALRFRPSNEIFAALGQTPPAAPARGGGGGRGGSKGGNGPAGPDSMAQPTKPAAGAASAAAGPTAAPGADPTARRPKRSTDQTASADPAAGAGGGRGGNGNGGGGRGGAGQGGQGGGRGGNMQDRMAAMTPDERTAFLERMRARGIDPNAPGGGRGGNAGGNGGGRQGGNGNAFAAAGGVQRIGGGAAKPAAAPAMTATSGATTIDALFGPLPPTESTGQVWLYQKAPTDLLGKLSRVPVRLGVSDGQQTALLSGDLKEDEDVVTNITTAAQKAASMAAGSTAPIFGQQQRGGGGPGGGGGGGGGGARGGGRGGP